MYLKVIIALQQPGPGFLFIFFNGIYAPYNFAITMLLLLAYLPTPLHTIQIDPDPSRPLFTYKITQRQKHQLSEPHPLLNQAQSQKWENKYYTGCGVK